MIKVRYYDYDENTERLHYWAADGSLSSSLCGIEPHKIIELTADGDELAYVYKQFGSCVGWAYGAVNRKSITWFGDIAKFIYANYDENDTRK
jgi:hypothetical protein